MRRLDWACAWRAKRRDEKANKHRKKPKRGRHTRDHRSARPPVCTRPHHPKEIYFPCYHSDARHAKGNRSLGLRLVTNSKSYDGGTGGGARRSTDKPLLRLHAVNAVPVRLGRVLQELQY